MMRSNYGHYRADLRAGGQPHAGIHAEMGAFDKLPPQLRFAVNYAPRMTSCPEVLRMVNHFRRKGERAGKTVAEADTDTLAKFHDACVRAYKRSFIDPT